MLYVNRTATDAGLSNCNGGAGPPFRLGIVSSASCDLRVGGSYFRYDTLEYAAGFLDFTPTGDINDSANVVDQLIKQRYDLHFYCSFYIVVVYVYTKS